WMDIERLHAMHHWAPDSTEAFVRSVEAGIDMHMQGDNYFEAVIEAVKSGRIPMKRIDEAAGKILEMKFAVGLFEAPLPSLEPLENAAEHRQTALQAAREGIVLLKNDGVLPFTAARRIFVTGPNADSQTILGDWAAPQPDSMVMTVLDGLKAEFPGATIDTMCFGGMISNVDAKGIAVARHKASAADVCIVVAGENSQRYSAFGRTCGENCDRDDLDLPGMQEELLEAIASTGKPTILVLMTGRANSIAWAKDNVDAILNVWEPGQMGGQAIAEVLSGKVNPSGKLPVTMPRSVGQVPTVYNHKHSQYSRLFATNETGPLWPFGFGLSYSSFKYSAPELNDYSVSITVTNEGPYDGAEVVQLYIRDEYASVTRPVKELKAFKRIFLKNGESQEVSFEITPDMLKCFGADNRWSVEPGDFTIMVGSSSADENLQCITLTVD
ncbi:MAG: glycoside hydrolase family 3 C-terminal domain-containing protein, partial [Bacteroidales bacterium]|nr:glycoside hydrolase family 3 C-terminal domain-containing protein [Bacteroidales bacterium]